MCHRHSQNLDAKKAHADAVRTCPRAQPQAPARHGRMTDGAGNAESHSRDPWRVSGHPVGSPRRSVKPSAKPTLVRTQHLPPPAKTARGLGFPRSRGPSGVVSSGVIGGQQAPLHHGGYGHMADGSRAGGAVHRTACPGAGWLTVVGEQPSKVLEDHYRWAAGAAQPSRHPGENLVNPSGLDGPTGRPALSNALWNERDAIPQFDDYFSAERWTVSPTSELFDESQLPDCGAAEVGFAN
jgi:hypothetical protein